MAKHTETPMTNVSKPEIQPAVLPSDEQLLTAQSRAKAQDAHDVHETIDTRQNVFQRYSPRGQNYHMVVDRIGNESSTG